MLKRSSFVPLSAALPPALADEGNSELVEEAIVYGHSQEIIGTADQASKGVVAFDNIRLPPMRFVGELAEYASRLPGEPEVGVEDIHFRPLEPLSVRTSVTYHW